MSSSDDLFEKEEADLLDFNSRLDFVNNIIKTNHTTNENDGTLGCFQMFQNVVNEFNNNSQFNKLNIVSDCIEKLKDIDKFDNILFRTYTLDAFLSVPLECVWWLKTNDIMTFALYYKEKQPNLIEDFKNLFNRNCSINELKRKKLTCDLLDEFICGAFAPRLGICRLNLSKMWFESSNNFLNCLADETIEAAVSDTDQKFLLYLGYVTERKCILEDLYKLFFLIILRKFLASNVASVNIYSCYKYQFLFQNMNDNTKITLFSIFRWLEVEELFKIILLQEKNMNWMNFCYAITASLQNENTKKKIVDKCNVYLNEAFKEAKVEELMKAFILARQSHTDPINSYKKWYSDTFGSNTNFCTSQNPTYFKYFMESLTQLLELENKHTLTIHVNTSLKAPPKCNSLIFDFKEVARARLHELTTSPIVNLGNCGIPILHLLEDCAKEKEITDFVRNVVNTHGSSFLDVFLQQAEKKGLKFVKQLACNEFRNKRNI